MIRKRRSAVFEPGANNIYGNNYGGGKITAPEDNSALIEAGIANSIRRSLRAQSLTGLALAGLLLTISPVAAYSSLFGSLAAFVPALVFAVVVAAKFGSDSAVFLRAAVVGEAVKLLLTALICLAVFVWVKPLAAGWFFTGMIVIILMGYIGLMVNAPKG